MGPTIDLDPDKFYKYCFDAIKMINLMKISKKIKSHPKDFAIRQKLVQISIVQCDFTGKMDADPVFKKNNQ